MSTVIRYSNTLFCDDVRHEAGDKLSLMGVYTGGSLVAPQQFPIVIPKLCMVINSYTGVDDPFKSLSLILYKDKEIIQQVDLPEEGIIDAAKIKLGRLSTTTIQIGVMIGLQGVIFDAPCILSVIAKTEREEFLSGKLRIESATQQVEASAPNQ